MTPAKYEAVLFDLDGTLVDTSPDMGGTINDMLTERGRAPIQLSTLRPLVSHGSRALVECAFGTRDSGQTNELIKEFLRVYGNRVARASHLFEGIDTLLDHLDRLGVRWGIVTNKPEGLSEALLRALQLWPRLAAHVGGDTLAVRKPDPQPLLHAASSMDVAADRCFYIGDAQRDIDAGNAAGMTTIAAGYGFLRMEDRPSEWGSDLVIESVDALCAHLLSQFR